MKGTYTMRANNWIAKVVLLSIALFIVSFASAQTTATPTLIMAPTATVDVNEAGTFVPGSAPFYLLIKATSNQTTAYNYTVIATLEDGSTKVITGQISRSDNNTGYTAASVSLGCDPVSVSTTVNEAN
jgi:hypothetical protein